MASIEIKKDNDFDVRPEVEESRQTFNAMAAMIAQHCDTPNGYNTGSFLLSNTAQLKRVNLNARKFDDCQNMNEGNQILETLITKYPNMLVLKINLREIGITEGRGSFEVTPLENGFYLVAQEVDCYKNSAIEEAHAVKRKISRIYMVNGVYNWDNMIRSLLPDGTLHITVNALQCPMWPPTHPSTIFSSLSKTNPFINNLQQQQMFSDFNNTISNINQCKNCGGTRNIGVQTMTNLLNMPNVQTQTSCSGLLENFSSFSTLTPCTCDSLWSTEQ